MAKTEVVGVVYKTKAHKSGKNFSVGADALRALGYEVKDNSVRNHSGDVYLHLEVFSLDQNRPIQGRRDGKPEKLTSGLEIGWHSEIMEPHELIRVTVYPAQELSA